jgi:tetratricopeptide (TPR) repeat protein
MNAHDGLADLGSRLQAGESIEWILFEGLDAPTRTTLMRCAVIRTFDEQLYDEVLRASDGPSVSELLASDLVETAGNGSYRVADLGEVGYLAFWAADDRAPIVGSPVPVPLAQVARDCARWFDEHRLPLAQLDALVQSDVEAAGRLFTRLFTEADSGHDLAGCHDLLDVLDRPDRIPLYIRTGLAEQHLQYRARLAARTRWASDYSASAPYFRRPVIERHLEGLLAAKPSRVLQLFARGGMGKTMQLRWFLGRRCASGPVHIPCARIDFDHEDASRASRNPWLVALRIAEQLEDQLVGDRFRGILESHGVLVPLLYDEVPEGSAHPPPLPDDVDGRDVVGRIAAVLAEGPREEPVVVVIDTCEELLRPGIDPCDLFTMLSDLVSQVPALRLVLAGRYDLTDHGGLRSQECDVAALFPSMVTCRVPSFTKADRRRYLVELRGLPEGPLVDIIVERTARSPFHLAIFADLARIDPDVTEEGLRTAQEPGMLYLIERILKRVEDDVRWLLLYGVVPRRLSFTFLHEVMWPHMAADMSGSQGSASTKAREQLPLQNTRPPETDADIRALWDRMLGYAARYSWVWVDHNQDLRFHPDVLEPLRTVARESEFYEPLHLGAIRYYEGLAESDSSRWDVWTAEALYHRFQLEGPRAESAWRQALTRAQASGNNDAVRVIAREPLRREYLDEDDQPRLFRRPRTRIITWDVVVTAHVHLALAAADQAGRGSAGLSAYQAPAGRSQWTEAQRHLRAAREIARTHDVPLPQPMTDLVESRVAIGVGDIRRAAELILKRDPQGGGPSLRAVVDVTQRVVRQLLGDSNAWTGFEESWSRTDTTQDSRERFRVALATGAAAADRGQYATALQWLDTASELNASGDQENRVPLHANVLTLMGSSSAARRLLVDRTGYLSRLARIKVELAADRPVEALREVDLTVLGAPGEAGSELDSALYRLRGIAHAELLQVDEALADLYLARATARSMHDPSAEATASAHIALLHLRQIGDLRNAGASIEDALAAAAPAGSYGWLSTVLASSEWQARTNNSSGARATIADVRQDGPLTPWVAVRLSLARLLIDPEEPNETLERLADELRRVDPPSARLLLLGDLTSMPDLEAGEPQRNAVLATVTDALEDHDPSDLSALAWRAAALHRALGNRDAARELLLTHVLPMTDTNAFLWWRLLDGMRSCGLATNEDPDLPEDPFRDFDDASGLRAAWLIRLVQWRHTLETRSWSGDRLELARTLLQRPQTLPTRWGAELDETHAMLDEKEGSTESARSSAATASTIWAKLGQTKRRAEIAFSYELGSVEAGGSDLDVELHAWFGEGIPDRADINVQVTAHAESLSPGRIERMFHVGRPSTDLRDSGTRLRAVSGLIAASWQPWGENVGQSLERVGLTTALGRAPGDLRLVTEHVELAALPWELVSLPGQGARPLPRLLAPQLVYRCLDTAQRQPYEVAAAQAALARLGFFRRHVDGLVGSDTRSAVEASQEAFGLPPNGQLTPDTWQMLRNQVKEEARQRSLRVLMIVPSPTSIESTLELSSVMDLMAVYRGSDAIVQTMALSDVSRADRRPDDDEKPDVVHILAPIDLVGGNVVIDTGGAPTRVRAMSFGLEQLPVTVLGDFLATLSRESFGPAVIVETPLRPSRVESARALLLRNVVGQTLLNLGRTEAVLCTGGASPDRQHSMRETLVAALSRRGDLAEVTSALQASAGPDPRFEDVVSLLGSALFVQRSPRTLFPVGCA